jgi:hypothetical protein
MPVTVKIGGREASRANGHLLLCEAIKNRQHRANLKTGGCYRLILPTKAVGVILSGDGFPRSARTALPSKFLSPIELFLLGCFFLGLFLGCHDELL